MRVLERLVFDLIGRYVPIVDLEALRVDLAKQRATLSAVDLAPATHQSQPYVLLCRSIPFLLSTGSSLNSLNISFPGQLTAEIVGLVLRFLQIPFSGSPRTPAVARAFDGRKRARLAEGERQATGLFAKLLLKVLPLVLHRLQVSLSNTEIIFELASGKIAKVSVGQIILASVSTRDALTGDLSKDISLHGIRIVVDGLVVFEVHECIVELRYSLCQLKIDFRFNGIVRGAVSDHVANEIRCLDRDTSLWECAVEFRRPFKCVTDAAKEWWQYTVRVLMRNGGGLNGPATVMNGLRLCKEYHSLHVARLRKGAQATNAETDRCDFLESLLSVETVLALRAKARKAVRADQAARYAAEDWLGWMAGIATSRSSQDRENTANEIRQAIITLEDAEGNDEKLNGALSALGLAPAHALTLNRVETSLRCSEFSFHFLSSEDRLQVDFVMNELMIYLDIDGAFASYTLDISLGDCVVGDNRFYYLHRFQSFLSTDGKAVRVPLDEKTKEDNFPFRVGSNSGKVSLNMFALAATKSEQSNVATVHIALAPFALHLDISQLSPIFQIFTILFIAKGAGITPADSMASPSDLGLHHDDFNLISRYSDGRSHLANSECMNRPFGSVEDMARERKLFVDVELEMVCPCMHIVLSSGLAVVDSECELRHAVLCSFSHILVQTNTCGKKSSVALELSVMSCTVANDTFDAIANTHNRRVDNLGFIRFHGINEPCFQGSSIKCSHLADSLDVSMSHVSAALSGAEMRALAKLLICFADEIKAEFPHGFVAYPRKMLFPNIPSIGSVRSRMRLNYLEALGRYQLGYSQVLSRTTSVTKLNISLREIQLRAAIVLASQQTSVQFTGTALAIFCGTGRLKIDLGEFEMNGASTDCAMKLTATGAGARAMILTFSQFENDGTIPNILSNCVLELGSIEARLNLKAVLSLFEFCAEGFYCGRRLFRYFQKDAQRRTAEGTGGTGTSRYIVSASLISLEAISDATRARIRAIHCFAEGQKSTWKGHIDALHILDLTGRSGLFAEAVRDLNNDDSGSAVRHLRFNARPGYLNLLLASLQITLLRSFLENVVLDFQNANMHTFHLIDHSMSSAHELGDPARVINIESVPDTSIPLAGRKQEFLQVSVHCTKIFVVLPFSPNEGAAVGMELPELAVVISPDSWVVSARRIRVVASTHLNPTWQGYFHPEYWGVVVSSLELDITRDDSDIAIEPPESSNTTLSRDTTLSSCRLFAWDIRIQSKTVLVSANQLLTFVRVFRENLLNASISRPAQVVSKVDVGLSSCGNPNLEPVLVSTHRRTTLFILAPGLEIEILTDENPARVCTGLACGILGPLCFKLDSQVETGVFTQNLSHNVRWSFNLSSLRIEDRRESIPDVFRLVLSAQRDCSAAPWESDTIRDTDQHEVPASCIRLTKHDFVDSKGLLETKGELYIFRPELIFCPGLFQELHSVMSTLAFDSMTRSASSYSDANHDHIIPGGSLFGMTLQCRDPNAASLNQTQHVSRKMSVLVEMPRVFVSEQPSTLNLSGVQIFCERIKLSVLVTVDDRICPGSFVRVRGINVSLCPGDPQFDTINLGSIKSNDIDIAGQEDPSDLRFVASPDSNIVNGPAGASVISLSRDPESSENMNYSRPVSPGWAELCRSSVVLLRIKSFKIRPSLANSTACNMSISSVLLDGTAKNLSQLFVLFSRLYALGEGPVNVPMNIPLISMSVNDISLSVRILQHCLAHDSSHHHRSGGDGSSIISAFLSCTLQIADNAETLILNSSVRSVDAYDGQTGEWDIRHVIEPFTATFKWAATCVSGEAI